MVKKSAVGAIVVFVCSLIPLQAAETRCYVQFEISSDPSGAEIYFEDNGKDLGKTSEAKPLRWWLRTGSVYSRTFLAKKQGYKTAHHKVVIRHTDKDCYESLAAARKHPRKLTIILDAGSD